MDNSEIKSVLQILGERVPPGSQLILIGGGALALLGSPRLTIHSELPGHSNVNLTLNQYSHIINPMNTVVADTLDKAVNR